MEDINKCQLILAPSAVELVVELEMALTFSWEALETLPTNFFLRSPLGLTPSFLS
jgi:hypothetical protein